MLKYNIVMVAAEVKRIWLAATQKYTLVRQICMPSIFGGLNQILPEIRKVAADALYRGCIVILI
jgi:hypothetical protein